MAAELTIAPPRSELQNGAPAARSAGLARVRLGLRLLALQASSGTPVERLAPALADLFEREVASLRSASAPDRLQTAAAFVGGVCGLARWLAPGRTAEVVPPLGVVLRYVGRALESQVPTTLWIDFVVPNDGRRLAASDWAHDIRLLLMRAGVPHRAEMALLQSASTPTLSTRAWPQVCAAWGCDSLLSAYSRSGEERRTT